jgi:hypothetical protein
LRVAVQCSSAREAEKRWQPFQLRVEIPSVKKRVSCKIATVKRLYVCCSYSESVIITVLKSVARK